MSQVRFRQVARLEKRALFYIEQKRRYEEEERASHRERYFVKIANLALLILYGDPKIGEPLTCAWQRCLESRAWKECREKHADRFGRSGGEVDGPFDDRGAQSIAQYFHEYILPDLPGADDIEKLNSVFAKAPAWLLWFAYAESSILCLGLKLPDLSSMSRFARAAGGGTIYRAEPLSCAGCQMVSRTNTSRRMLRRTANSRPGRPT